MPLTGPWSTHPVACTLAAEVLRDALLELRRTPIPYPGHVDISSRVGLSRDSGRRWRTRVNNCRSVVASLFPQAGDGDFRKCLTTALVKFLGPASETRAGEAVEYLGALRAAANPPPESTEGIWIPSGEWWASGTAALAAELPITQADIDAESGAGGKHAGSSPRLPVPQLAKGAEDAGTALEPAAFGGWMLAQYRAARVVSHHLARDQPCQDGLTRAALAFRELAAAHQRETPEDMFRRLADRGHQYIRFGSLFAADSAAESLWRLSRHIHHFLVAAITDGLASRAAEADRVALGVVHPSEFALVRGRAREACRAWVVLLDDASGLAKELAKEAEWLQRRADEESRLARLEAALDGAPRTAPGSGAKVRRKGVNARMLQALQDDLSAVEWPASRWASHLQCAESTVKETKTWKEAVHTLRAKYRGKSSSGRPPRNTDH